MIAGASCAIHNLPFTIHYYFGSFAPLRLRVFALSFVALAQPDWELLQPALPQYIEQNCRCGEYGGPS